MQTDLIGQGLELMLYGMGTVVVFLTLLVFTTSGMSLLVRRFIPAHPAESEGKPPAASDPTLLAVITAAIRKHRTRNHP